MQDNIAYFNQISSTVWRANVTIVTALKDLIPDGMRFFHFGTCPSVHEMDGGKLVIIGKRTAAVDPALDESLRGNVGPDEFAVVIEPALLENVPRGTPQVAGRAEAGAPSKDFRRLEAAFSSVAEESRAGSNGGHGGAAEKCANSVPRRYFRCRR